MILGFKLIFSLGNELPKPKLFVYVALWTWVTVSNSTCSCLPSPPASHRPHAKSPSKITPVLSHRPCQGPYGFCQTLASVTYARAVCPPGTLCLSPGPQWLIATYLHCYFWQCVSMIATHFSCFCSIPPHLPALLTSPARHNSGPPGPMTSAISFQELLEKKAQNLNL